MITAPGLMLAMAAGCLLALSRLTVKKLRHEYGWHKFYEVTDRDVARMTLNDQNRAALGALMLVSAPVLILFAAFAF